MERINPQLINQLSINSALIIGAGSNTELIEGLSKALLNDIKPIESNHSVIIEDLFKLDYNLLSKEYPALITQQLCGPQGGTIILDAIKLWTDFEIILIEQCNNPNHYIKGKEGQLITAQECTNYLMNQGYNTKLLINEKKEHYNLILIASKKTIPEIKESAIINNYNSPNNGFFDPNPPGYFDGNYYD